MNFCIYYSFHAFYTGKMFLGVKYFPFRKALVSSLIDF